MFVFTFFDWLIGSLFRGRKNKRVASEVAALRARGVIAQAIVVGASTHQSRQNEGGKQIKIDYTVDVYPQYGTPFRAAFSSWQHRTGYTAVMGELQGEAGQQIWVTFDPADPAQMIFEYSEQARVSGRAEGVIDERRAHFNAVAEPLDQLLTTGTPAQAVIQIVEDLVLPYPKRASTAMRLHVDVSPAGGSTYRAVIPCLVALTSLAKYSAGRQVFVRFDSSNPLRVRLDSERNLALPN